MYHQTCDLLFGVMLCSLRFTFTSPSCVFSRFSRALSRFFPSFRHFGFGNYLVVSELVSEQTYPYRWCHSTFKWTAIHGRHKRKKFLITTMSIGIYHILPFPDHPATLWLEFCWKWRKGRAPSNHMSRSCGNGTRSRWNIPGPCICKFVMKSTPAALVWARLVSIVCVWTATAFSRSSWLRSKSLP